MHSKPTYEELAQRVAQLEAAAAKHQAALQERLKELQCLSDLAQIIEARSSTEEILQETVNRLPAAWQYPEVTCARIETEKQVFRTTPECVHPCEQCTRASLKQDLTVNRKTVGKIRVCYLADRPEADEGPFLKEERQLLEMIAERLGRVIERMRMSQAVAESEAQLGHIVENMPVMLDVMDENGQILIWNQECERQTGYTAAEMVGNPRALEWLYPDPDYREKMLTELMALKNDFRDQAYTLICKDGTPKTISWSNISGRFPIPGWHTWAVGVDITERQKAAEALRESESRLASIFNTTTDAILVFDEAGAIVLTNPAANQMYGYDDNEMIGLPGHRIVHPDYRHLFAEFKQKCRDNGHFQAESRDVRRDGRTFDIEVNGNLFVHQGKAHLLAMVRDITERKQDEAELQLQSLTLNQIEDRVTVTDLEGYITYVNHAECLMLGMPREKLIGQHISVFGEDPEDGPRQKDILQESLEKGSWRGEVINFSKDGRKVILDCRIQTVTNEQGAPLGLCGISTDITDRKQMEAEKKQLETQVRQTQKLESIGRLAGGVAHDLNNLLSPILGYSEMLLEDAAQDKDTLESLEEINQAAQRARDLVRQLLAFSRKQILSFQSLAMNQLIGGFEKLLRRTIREDIQIHLRLAENLPPIQGDAGQLEQVIMNLAVNAADAMPDGGQLNIETAAVNLDTEYAAGHPEVIPGPHVMMGFSDTGMGMDEETRTQIFEPFFTTKAMGEGTGLGLATVYGIVKQHEGHIWVYSEPGRGSTFKVYLPAAKDQPLTERAASQPIRSLTGQESILVVEDNSQLRKLACHVLSRQGYTVHTAEDGRLALDLLCGLEALDLLLTDVVMPHMNGRELYQRALQTHPHLKVLYMSGYTDNVIAHHGVLDEGVQFIEKPFNIRFLAARVREVLEN